MVALRHELTEHGSGQAAPASNFQEVGPAPDVGQARIFLCIRWDEPCWKLDGKSPFLAKAMADPVRQGIPTGFGDIRIVWQVEFAVEVSFRKGAELAALASYPLAGRKPAPPMKKVANETHVQAQPRNRPGI